MVLPDHFALFTAYRTTPRVLVSTSLPAERENVDTGLSASGATIP